MERATYSKFRLSVSMKRLSLSITILSSFSSIRSKEDIYGLKIIYRGNKDSEQVEAMVKKYLFKSHGKFRLALIDISSNGPVTGRSIPVSLLLFQFKFIGIKSSSSIPYVQIINYIRVARSPNQVVDKGSNKDDSLFLPGC